MVVWWCGGVVVWCGLMWFGVVVELPIIGPPQLTLFNFGLDWVVAIKAIKKKNANVHLISCLKSNNF